MLSASYVYNELPVFIITLCNVGWQGDIKRQYHKNKNDIKGCWNFCKWLSEDGLPSISCLFLFLYVGYSLVISLHAKKFILIEVMKQFIHIENNTSCPVEIRSLHCTNQASEAQ